MAMSQELRALKPLAPKIYTHEAVIQFYGFALQTRMAVICLEGRRLCLYSPTPLTDAVAADLETLGTVALLVSPNKIHNQTLQAYCTAYPNALLCAPPGLQERQPQLSVQVVLKSGMDFWAAVGGWGQELEVLVTAGNCFFEEALLYHPHSGTLLVGDFVENLRPATTPGCCGGPLARACRLQGRPMPSPEFWIYTQDAKALETSVSLAATWSIQRIFLCHGSMIEGPASANVFAEVVGELARWARRWGDWQAHRNAKEAAQAIFIQITGRASETGGERMDWHSFVSYLRRQACAGMPEEPTPEVVPEPENSDPKVQNQDILRNVTDAIRATAAEAISTLSSVGHNWFGGKDANSDARGYAAPGPPDNQVLRQLLEMGYEEHAVNAKVLKWCRQQSCTAVQLDDRLYTELDRQYALLRARRAASPGRALAVQAVPA
ncbi:CPK4 [Symbiodinium natans]|uniref:CPK4 protein n=1 Tax=Symbiodinium natans TaxID=878477 RepID=A0A812HBK0_9DINO|nr:CPK4 [Symbiodinium natans]